jgi:hypothetical protein
MNASSEFSRIVYTTTAEYLRKIMKNVEKRSAILSLARSKGRIHKVPGGPERIWPVQHKRGSLRTMQDMPSLSFPRVVRHVNAKVTPRGYWMADQQSWWEKQIQGTSTQAIINIHQTIAKLLKEDVEAKFPAEMYVDDSATGNSQRMGGLDSMFSISGAVSGNSRVGSPNDTYATLSTALGTKGTWNSTAWPGGTGAEGYHYWSPLVLLYDSPTQTWGGVSNTWKDNCDHIMTYGRQHCQKRGGRIDAWVLTDSAWYEMQQKVAGKENLYSTRGDNSLLASLGFTTLNFQGVEVTWEADVPPNPGSASDATNTGYGLSFSDLELCHWSPSLFEVQSIPFNEEALTYRFLVLIMANMMFNPQRQVNIRSTS